MSDNAETAVVGWPRGLRVLASVLIVVHLFALGQSVLSASSGPWPTQEGMDFATPPQFVQVFEDVVNPYLLGLKLHHQYQFPENFVANQVGAGTEAEFEIRLLDEQGKQTGALHFPDPTAPSAVQFRQRLLASSLNMDAPVVPLPGEMIPAPDQPVRTRRMWDGGEGQAAHITTVQEHLIPRDRTVFGPTDFTMVVARSLARYGCRKGDAPSVEIVRRSRPYIPPDVLFNPSMQAATFDDLNNSFGVFNAPKN